MKSVKTMLKGLTHEELREWAGDRIFDRGRNYISRVSQLSRTEDGTLAAWVSGSDEYATTVRRDGREDFDYDCTCPYDDGPCKHAVAVLLAAAGQLNGGGAIPLLDPCADLALEMFGDPEDDEEWADAEEPDVESSSPEEAKGRLPRIESILAEKSREELVSLLAGLASDFPDVARRINETAQLETGQVGKIVCALKKEIRSLTAEDVWYNPWKSEGNLPDYSHVEQQLRALSDRGHADAVLELGEELWQRGNKQVECSHDEGDTAMKIAACLEIVLRALPSSSMPRVEQVQWLVDHELDDEYALLAGIDKLLNGPLYGETEWSKLAETLEVRLENRELPKSGSFSETYRRERVMRWLCHAYRRSGRQKKVLPLLEREADRCRSYETLVNALLEAGEPDRARQWCIRGFDRTIKDAPGIASALQKRLRQLAEE
ncbi:SWIM zinc finger family protein [Pelobacter propionicus]|uniref:Zinc finger, SWIM domain protein n=1 Tax=Pelobacter propionicus (strain DSM 2379 / NBRC 103807 / OttBd1) TaxID=338966 RepID=A1ANL7_PELPD|nr:SWIM zinc finger family protein [Pelobacter propionicus]ABK98937.1 zinc finger, SWIM domain protein [Pelobacter propionicus DSM 2379]